MALLPQKKKKKKKKKKKRDSESLKVEEGLKQFSKDYVKQSLQGTNEKNSLRPRVLGEAPRAGKG